MNTIQALRCILDGKAVLAFLSTAAVLNGIADPDSTRPVNAKKLVMLVEDVQQKALVAPFMELGLPDDAVVYQTDPEHPELVTIEFPSGNLFPIVNGNHRMRAALQVMPDAEFVGTIPESLVF